MLEKPIAGLVQMLALTRNGSAFSDFDFHLCHVDGNYEDLREAAEADSSLLDQPDEMGYYPLQWAALNNRVAIISYLIDKSVDINR